MVRSTIPVLVVLVVALVPGGAFADDAAAALEGIWYAKTDAGQLRVRFSNGRALIVETGFAGTETTNGSYRVVNGAIEVVPDGSADALRYPYRMVDGALHVQDQDGTAIVLRKLAAKEPSVPKPELPGPLAKPTGPCKPATTFVQWICLDQGGIQNPATGRPLEAFRMWIPDGWRVQGGVRWKINYKSVLKVNRSDLVNPAQVSFTVSSPDGSAAITVYPDEPFTDLSGAPAAPLFPRGSKYGGTTVWPPLNPRQYVEQILFPRYFQGVQGQVVAYKDVPALASFFHHEATRFNQFAKPAGIASLRFAAGATTVDFQAGNTAYRELFVTVPMYIQMPGMVMWWPRMAWSVRAPRECFEGMQRTLLTSIFSFKLNGLWFLLYKRIVDQNWRGIAAVDNTIRKIDSEIVASRAKTASIIHRQLYPVLTGMAIKKAPGYAPLPLDSMKNHAIDPQGRLRELPDGTNLNDLAPGWKPLEAVPIK